MSKFKVGDKVRVKKDLEVGKHYDGLCRFVDEMAKNKGKTATIISLSFDDPNRFLLDIDPCWRYSPEMLESTLTTSEMIAALSANPGQKYRNNQDHCGWYNIMRVQNGYLYLDIYNGKSELISSELSGGGLNGNIKIKSEWTLITPEPKSVSFMEAVKAHESGKTVTSLYFEFRHTYNPHNLKDGMVDENGCAVGTPEILYGKWFIEGE